MEKIKRLTPILLSTLLIFMATGCEDSEKIAVKASGALAHGNYKGALKTLLELSDNTIERNDSLMLMLSEAYYGVTGSFRNIDADAICDMDVTPDGKWILFTDLQNGRVVEYSFPELRFNRVIETGSPVYGIDLSPDGTIFAAALSNSSIDLFDLASGKKVKSLSGHTNRARTVVFMDSTHLVSGGNDQYIITWDLEQDKMLDHQWRHRKNVKSLKRSEDSDYLISASNDGTAIIWDFADKSHGNEFRKVVHGRNYVNDTALSPDNEYLVTVSGDGDAKIWNARLGVIQERIPLEDVGCSVEFSPDGKYIVIGGYAFVHLINTDKWTVEEKIPVSNDSVWGVRFIGDNKLAFVDSSHFYEVDVLFEKDLIKAARRWLKDHED